MPKTTVVFYKEGDGSVPLLEWFDTLPPKVQDKCTVRIERLAELGHELRRPEADYLGEDIHQLCVKHSGMNTRMLYFFHGRTAVALSHGFVKQRATVPPREMKKAIQRKARFESDPTRHTKE